MTTCRGIGSGSDSRDRVPLRRTTLQDRNRSSSPVLRDRAQVRVGHRRRNIPWERSNDGAWLSCTIARRTAWYARGDHAGVDCARAETVFTGDFRVLELSGGGMGRCIAHRISTERERALKIITSSSVRGAPREVHPEARIGGRVQSDHVVEGRRGRSRCRLNTLPGDGAASGRTSRPP